MCILALAWQQHPQWPLLLIANRDEAYQRPSRPAAPWIDQPDLIGGQDLRSGGAWLLTTTQGRWAVITNYRDGRHTPPPNPPSRGHLVSAACTLPLPVFAQQLEDQAKQYAPFNLLWGDLDQAWYFGPQSTRPLALKPGTHLLSNALLNTPWPKTQRLATQFKHWLDEKTHSPQSLFATLADRTQAAAQDCPDTGIGLDLELKLSPIFIQLPSYGTRCSTLLWGNPQQMNLWERTFSADGNLAAEHAYSWPL